MKVNLNPDHVHTSKERCSLLSIAVPSWVKPGTVADNATFLAGKVAEVGLCCFEWQASATMEEADLPASLATLPLRWHVHLPTDLSVDGQEAAREALAVWKRVAFLHPRVAVLHLPPFANGAGLTWLRHFMALWRQEGLAPELLAVENVRGASPLDYGPDLWKLGVSFCLDVAHAIAYAQEHLWNGDAFSCQCMQRLRLSHWSAPGDPKPDGAPADRHLPLTECTPAQRASLLQAVSQLKPLRRYNDSANRTVMIEVFDWENVLRSWPVLQELWKT